MTKPARGDYPGKRKLFYQRQDVSDFIIAAVRALNSPVYDFLKPSATPQSRLIACCQWPPPVGVGTTMLLPRDLVYGRRCQN